MVAHLDYLILRTAIRSEFKYVDFLNYEEVENQITSQTKALFIEPISNPQMIDIDVTPYYVLSKNMIY